MSINVKLFANNFNNNDSNPQRDSNYCRRRREWWRANKAKLGTDWNSINQLQVEVASFLADVKRRGAA